MSLEQLRLALDCPVDMPSSARHVLLILATYADAEGKRVFPSVSTLSRQSGLDQRTVRRMLRTLESAGQIEASERSIGRVPTHYQLTITPGISPPGRIALPGTPPGLPGHTVHSTRAIASATPGVLPPNPSEICHKTSDAGARAREAETRALPAEAGNGTSNGAGNVTEEMIAAAQRSQRALLEERRTTTAPSEAARLVEAERRRREAAALAEMADLPRTKLE